MELFHGSFVAVSKPSVTAGRENLDFGHGFYLTSLRSQAEAWAKVIASRRGRRIKPVISVFHFDRELAAADGVRFKVFESYDLEWLDYVVSCRRRRMKYEGSGIVEKTEPYYYATGRSSSY